MRSTFTTSGERPLRLSAIRTRKVASERQKENSFIARASSQEQVFYRASMCTGARPSATWSSSPQEASGRHKTASCWPHITRRPFREDTIMAVHRRKVLKGLAATGAAIATLRAPYVHAQAPFKIGLLTVKTGPLAQGGIQMEQGILTFLKEKGNTPGGAQDRVHLGRHRRQSGRRPHQGAGADRARQGQRHPRAARRLRAPGHHQLCARQRHPADQSRSGGRRHPAPGQSLRHPSLRDVGAVLSRHGRLRDQGAQIPARGDDLGGFRVRLRADGRLPARVRGQRRQAWSRSCGRRW